MTTWQPPIPSGALYSKPARALGPALALLAYCYDIVDREGWIKLNLKDAAGSMEEPYPNVKRWWQALTDGKFFAEIENHGRNGMRARFKDVWLDWRVLRVRHENAFGAEKEPEVIPNIENERSEMISNEQSGHNRDTIGTNERSEMISNEAMYKEDHHDQESEIAARKKRDRTHSNKQEDMPEHRAYLERKKAIETAYVQELGYTPAAFGREAKAAKWLSEQNYTPEQIVGCYRYLRKDDFYARQHISLEVVAKQIGAWLKLKQQIPANGHVPAVQKETNALALNDVLAKIAQRGNS